MNIEEADIEAAIVETGAMLGYFHIGESIRGYLGAGTHRLRPRVPRPGQGRLRRADHLRILLLGGGEPAAVRHPRDLAQPVDRRRDLAGHAKDFIEAHLKAAQEAHARSKVGLQ